MCSRQADRSLRPNSFDGEFEHAIQRGRLRTDFFNRYDAARMHSKDGFDIQDRSEQGLSTTNAPSAPQKLKGLDYKQYVALVAGSLSDFFGMSADSRPLTRPGRRLGRANPLP